MPWQYWASVLPFALLGGLGLALARLRYGRRVARDWAAVGMRYGSLVPLVTANAVLGACCGYAVGNMIAQVWL